ncbi:hypothetical protein [Qipengyuania sp.]|uniref:hypothetical protein n=1 Tax=Qipengyuania sp. TaxID=2004515 RepID=UPI003BAA285E
MKDERPWFAPKRYGYGAGLPIAWQGWAVLAVYIIVMIAPAPLIERDPIVGLAIVAPIWLVATILVIFIAKRKTRGGWRFRDGEED